MKSFFYLFYFIVTRSDGMKDWFWFIHLLLSLEGAFILKIYRKLCIYGKLTYCTYVNFLHDLQIITFDDAIS